MNRLSIFVLVLLCLCNISCIYLAEKWWDNQTENLECWPPTTLSCMDKAFYICPVSLKWIKLVDCQDLENITVGGIYDYSTIDFDDNISDYIDLYSEISLDELVRCCNE